MNEKANTGSSQWRRHCAENAKNDLAWQLPHELTGMSGRLACF